MVLNYLRGHLLLLKFYLVQVPLLWRLPAWLTNPAELERHLADLRDGSSSSIYLTVPSMDSNIYNRGLRLLESDLQTLHGKKTTSTSTSYQILIVRCAMVAAAWYGSISATLIFGTAQFLTAPYSFWVSFTTAVTQFNYILLPHYLIYWVLIFFFSYLEPYLPDFISQSGQIPINYITIMIFFIADQSLCLYIEGVHRRPLANLLGHAVLGFLNNKTMPLVVLLICRHHSPSLSLWPLLLEGYLLQLTPRLTTLLAQSSLHFNALFYHHHRMAHTPHVYEQVALSIH